VTPNEESGRLEWGIFRGRWREGEGGYGKGVGAGEGV